MRKVVAIFVFAALLGTGAAVAQETTGVIKGMVSSQDGATLPGVTVTINDADTGLQRTAITDTRGEYQFVALPPGRYDFTANLDGFQTVKRNVEVSVGRSTRNDFQMALGAITDVIEVTGEAPLVDVTSTVTGITVSTDTLNGQIPLGREATQVALLAPSTTQGDTAFEGGDYTPGQKLASLGGASVAENSYQVNGLNITNFRNGLGSSMVPFEFVEEMQVKTGGYEAEFGRSTGGVINMVTKSGTNAFHGGVSAYYEPESLQEQEPNTYAAENQAEESESLEANATLGGPIWKDKVFFFGFVRYTNDEWSTVTADERGEPNSGVVNHNSVDEPYWGGKLDFNITPSHRLEGTFITDQVDQVGEQYFWDRTGGAGQGDYQGTSHKERGGDNYIGKYTGIFTENFLLSAQYGQNNFDRINWSTPPFPYAYDGRSGSVVRVGLWSDPQESTGTDERTAYRIDGDIYVGSHSIRAGMDYEDNFSDDLTSYSGGVYLRYYSAGLTTFTEDLQGNPLDPDDELVRVRHYNTEGSFKTYSNALYAQDSWAVTPNLTVNIGVRAEVFENRNGLGERFIEIDDQYSPRLGAIWDPTGNGKAKVFASYGRYFLPIASNTNVRMAGNETFDENYYVLNGELDSLTAWPIGWVDPGFGNAGDGANTGAVGNGVRYRIISDGEVPDWRETLSTNIKPMSQDEIIVGYEQMVGEDWSLGARVVARQFNEVIEDFTIDQGLWEQYGLQCFNPDNPDSYSDCENEYRLGNPGSDFEGYYDIDGDGELDAISMSAEFLGYPEAERKYYALELTFKRRFADNWMLQGSYTWSHLYGNYEGYVNSEIGQDDAGITQGFDFASLMDYSSGNLPQDRRHNMKLFGTYAFDFGLQVGGNFYFRSGRPVNSLGEHPTDGFAQQYGPFSFYTDGVPCPRGCAGTTDDIWGMDAMLKYDIKLAGAMGMDLRLDVFNLFDQDGVTEVNEVGDLSVGAPNPDFRRATHYQSPRAVRFGVGFNF